MTDYRLVPVEPTQEMEQAGGAVYWENIEDVCGIYRAMVSVAPAVQGEPVEGIPATMKIEHHSPGIAIEKDIFGTVHIKVGDFDYIQIQYQYPHTDNARQLRHAMLIADVLAGTSPQPAEQQPVPDVEVLVETLELMIDTYDNGGWPSASVEIAKRVITAYRKGGEE